MKSMCLALVLAALAGCASSPSPASVDPAEVRYDGRTAEEWAMVLREAPRLEDDGESAALLQAGVDAFAAMGAPAAPALEPLFLDEHDATRYAAANALARLGSEGSVVAPALRPLLAEEGNSSLRLAALRALKAIGRQAQPLMDAAMALLDDPDVPVRVAAIEAVAAMRQMGTFHPAKRRLEELASRDHHHDVRRAAMRALGVSRHQLPPRETPIR